MRSTIVEPGATEPMQLASVGAAAGEGAVAASAFPAGTRTVTSTERTTIRRRFARRPLRRRARTVARATLGSYGRRSLLRRCGRVVLASHLCGRLGSAPPGLPHARLPAHGARTRLAEHHPSRLSGRACPLPRRLLRLLGRRRRQRDHARARRRRREALRREAPREGTTYTTLASSLLVETIFDLVVGSHAPLGAFSSDCFRILRPASGTSRPSTGRGRSTTRARSPSWLPLDRGHRPARRHVATNVVSQDFKEQVQARLRDPRTSRSATSPRSSRGRRSRGCSASPASGSSSTPSTSR